MKMPIMKLIAVSIVVVALPELCHFNWLFSKGAKPTIVILKTFSILSSVDDPKLSQVKNWSYFCQRLSYNDPDGK